jgi:hypothetical protein
LSSPRPSKRAELISVPPSASQFLINSMPEAILPLVAGNSLSLKVLKEVRKYLDKEYKIVGILGIEFSPTCGVYRIESERKVLPGKGILIEELEKEIQSK